MIYIYLYKIYIYKIYIIYFHIYIMYIYIYIEHLKIYIYTYNIVIYIYLQSILDLYIYIIFLFGNVLGCGVFPKYFPSCKGANWFHITSGLQAGPCWYIASKRSNSHDGNAWNHSFVRNQSPELWRR